MAQPGSFGAGQLKTNDKKQRDILNTMADTSQAMKENQSFLQGQQELFLRAQQFAQGEEQKVRQMNFETETDTRQRLKDSISQNYEIQLKNDEVESAGREQTLKAIGAFSKTATKMGADIINDRITKRRQAYSALVVRTGLDINKIRDIQALDNNLTESAFMQSQAIIDLKASGTSDEDINAIYHKVYKDSGSLAWIDNKAVARNSVEGFELALAEAKAANPNATGQELKAIYSTIRDTFVGGLGDGSGRQFTPEFLETTIGGKIRSSYNRAVIEATQQEGRENLADVEVKLGQAFDNTYRGRGGANGLMKMLADNKNSRKSLVKWLSNGLKSGALTPSEVGSILKTPLANFKGGEKTFIQAFGGTDEVATLVANINNKYTNNARQLRERQSNAIEDTNNEILRRANGALEDGVLDAAEYQEIYAYAESTGLDVSKLTALARIKKDTKGAKERTALEAYITQLKKDGNWNLETMRELDLPNDLFNKHESTAVAGSKLYTDPKVKGYKQRFKDMIANNPTIIGFDQEKSAGVNFMVNKYVEEFNKETQAQLALMANQGLPQDFDTAAESASLTIQRKITDAMNDPATLTQKGEFVEFTNSFKDISKDEVARRSLKHKINAAVQTEKWGEVYKALNKEEFIEFTQQNQGQVNPVAELIAATMNSGITAEQVHNKIAGEFGLEPLDSTTKTREEINASIPPILKRYAVFDRIEARSFAHRDGAGTAPRRGSFAETGDYSSDPPSEGAMSRQQVIDIAVSAGFTPEQAYTVSQIGMGESGRDPTNSTERSGLRARTGEDSVGLMQINWGYHKDRGWLQKLGINKREDLFDPVLNMKAAKYLYDQRGNFNDWTVYTKGIYLNY